MHVHGCNVTRGMHNDYVVRGALGLVTAADITLSTCKLRLLTESYFSGKRDDPLIKTRICTRKSGACGSVCPSQWVWVKLVYGTQNVTAAVAYSTTHLREGIQTREPYITKVSTLVARLCVNNAVFLAYVFFKLCLCDII